MASSIATKWIMTSNGNLQCRTCEFYASAIQSQVEGRSIFPCCDCQTITYGDDGTVDISKTLKEKEKSDGDSVGNVLR